MTHKVEIYSTPTCPYCNIAKAYFKEQGTKYTEYNVADDETKAKEMIEKSGQMSVPVIIIDDDIIVGFEKEKIRALLEK